MNKVQLWDVQEDVSFISSGNVYNWLFLARCSMFLVWACRYLKQVNICYTSPKMSNKNFTQTLQIRSAANEQLTTKHILFPNIDPFIRYVLTQLHKKGIYQISFYGM